LEGVPRDQLPVNWPLIGLVGLSVEFWVVVGILIAQYT
jgi:hypothetical protein